MGKRTQARRQTAAERHSMAKLIQEGESELIAAVLRGELTASQALNRERTRKAKERNR